MKYKNLTENCLLTCSFVNIYVLPTVFLRMNISLINGIYDVKHAAKYMFVLKNDAV
jgi:hypothetical protein